MRYGAIPGNLYERIGLWFGLAPIPVMDCLCSMMKARTLMAGVALGVFEELKRGPLAVPEIAAARSLDEQSLELLLRSLVVSGYLSQHGEKFALTPLSSRGLLRDSPDSLVAYVEWNQTHWEMLGHMEEVVRTGRGLDFHQMRSAADWRTYQQAMLQVAKPLRGFFGANVPVPSGAVSLLDVGGGHGLLGAAVCERHPELRSTVLELPQAVPAAQEVAREQGFDGLVTHRECDIVRDCWGSGHDVVLLANLLHHFEPEQAQQILCKAADALALFFRLTSGAGLHSVADLSRWTAESGFERLKTRRCLKFPDALLLTTQLRPVA